MTYIPPNSGFVTALQGTYYALVHLALAQLAYSSESNPLQIPDSFSSAVAQLPQLVNSSDSNPPCDNVHGTWNLDWGPAFCNNQGGFFNDNLLAIVSYRAPSNSGLGAPYFFAVLCRGTDVGGGIPQLGEDASVFSQQPWANVLSGSYLFGYGANATTIQQPITGVSTSAGNIATGAANALIAVSNLVPFNGYAGSTNYLVSALDTLLSTYPGTPIVVTGHSLGGTLVQVVAAFLQEQFSSQQNPPTIIPQAFAPTTAGDQSFVTYYNGLFQYNVPGATSGPPGSQFWVNSADLAPCAWSELQNAAELWASYDWPGGGSGPALLSLTTTEFSTLETILTSKLSQGTAGYARPANVILLNYEKVLPSQEAMVAFLQNQGQNPENWNTWSTQLIYQHSLSTYAGLITTKYSSNLLPYTLPG